MNHISTIGLSKYKEIKLKSIDLLLVTTIHGIQNIIRTSSLLIKLLWVLFSILSTAVCAYFISLSILNFLAYNAVTTINTVYETLSQFPTVSLCSVDNPITNLEILQFKFNLKNNSDYEIFQDKYYGKCFKFNSGLDKSGNTRDIFNLKTGGQRYGLLLDLNVTFTKNYESNELAILFHNHTVKSKDLRNKGLRISTGTKNFFQIERTFDEKLEKPFNDCYKNVNNFDLNKTLINFMRKTSDSYYKLECDRLCRNLKNQEESGCNCIKTFDSSSDCSNSKNVTIKACYNQFLSDFQNSNVIKICSQYCPQECDSLSYSISTNSEQFPFTGSFSNLTSFEYHQFSSYEEVQKYYVSIRAYFPELKYTLIKQQPKVEVVDLVSSVGGTLGLFLGISFLSFVEIIELLIEIAFVFFKAKK